MKLKTNITSSSEDSGGFSLNKADIKNKKLFLSQKTIGISISESENLIEYGYSIEHLKDAIVEIARYIFAVGGKVAYGGDMRQGGFTDLLFDLLAYYKSDKQFQPSERFHSYLAYPITTTLTKEKEADLKHIVSFYKIFPPEDVIINKKEFIKPESKENLYVWSRSLTEMRLRMEENCDARIFMGGRSFGFKGKYPGVIEEFEMALKLKHPVYIAGAFGGVSKEIIEALMGKKPEIFSSEYHLQNKLYKSFYAHFNDRHPDERIDFDNVYHFFKDFGFNNLSNINGLSLEDNIRLATTPHIDEIIYLIMRGLKSYFAEKK